MEDRAKARRRIQREKPSVVIGSPPCTDSCTLNQNINHKKMPAEEVRRRMTEARLHLEFCAEIYKEQMCAGRHFLHEHPLTATS